MALGKPNRSFEGKNYSLQFKLKDGDKFVDQGFFQVSESTGEKNAQGKTIYKETGRETDVSGNLVNILADSRETENGTVRSFTLLLNDPEKKENYYTRFGLGSSIGRRTANTVLNLQGFENVQLSSYSQQNQETKKIYPALSVRQGDSNTTVKPKFDVKDEKSEIPKARSYVGKGGKTEYDYTEQEVFLLQKLTEFGKVVSEASKKNVTASKPATTAAPAPANSAENLDEDVPF